MNTLSITIFCIYGYSFSRHFSSFCMVHWHSKQCTVNKKKNQRRIMILDDDHNEDKNVDLLRYYYYCTLLCSPLLCLLPKLQDYSDRLAGGLSTWMKFTCLTSTKLFLTTFPYSILTILIENLILPLILLC